MKIVIDISENDYWLACNYPETLISVYAQAIKNGTPLITDINNQPTIEAIPIEWLMKWEKEHTWEYESYFREIGKYPIECAIEDWRKENETN